MKGQKVSVGTHLAMMKHTDSEDEDQTFVLFTKHQVEGISRYHPTLKSIGT